MIPAGRALQSVWNFWRKESLFTLLRFEPWLPQTHSLTSVRTALARLLNDGDDDDALKSI
jgi:hypothetical protein